jgi:cytochrome c oxidase subunit 2
MMRGALSSPRRIRVPVLGTLLAAALLLGAAPAAWAGLLAPEGGSPNANMIATLYWVVFALGLVVFFVVDGFLVYSLIKYRYRRDRPEPNQIHGNTRLELGWTGAAIVLVIVISVITFIALPDIRTPEASGPPGEANNGVTFAATDQPPVPGGYDYPARGVFSCYEMVVPTNTTVVLRITSQDVQHAWWIPQLGGKFDAYPGHSNETWFKAPHEGEFEGQCAELCGENHAQMYAKVRAVSQSEYQAFIARRRAEIRASQQALARSRRQLEQQPEGRDTTVEG